MRALRNGLAGLLCLLLLSAYSVSAAQAPAPPQATLDQIQTYIANAWDSLSRSPTDCSTVVDTKLASDSVLYLPFGFPPPPSVQQLAAKCGVQVRHLPQAIHRLGEMDPAKIHPEGLLFLENRYVVPGGRFNEMYGWDSYFIVRGLVRDGRIDLAKGMVENFFFEIEHYGAVLNANRSYYLTRSQPPFLTSMIRAVYDAEKARAHGDDRWLARAYDYAVRDHALWISEPHLAGSTGLSRYFDFGSGPAPESLKDETGHYRQVAAYFLSQPGLGASYVIPSSASKPSPLAAGPLFALQICDAAAGVSRPSSCDSAGTVALSADYYKGDRAMRESGFDISFRFGPYGAATHHFAPVCLNSLLYKSEKDLEQISLLLGKKEDAEKWRAQAERRKEAIQKYLWDDQRGMFFDYDFEKQSRSSYEYVTTFYPLWAGLATPEQARRVMQHLSRFEAPGGLVMSPYETGGQWDFPYAWAPNQLMAVEGMRGAGFSEDANRISYKFLSMVLENFRRDATIREKYDAVKRSSETQVTAGYHVNIVGFGWTNGVFLVLLHELPAGQVARLSADAATAGATP
ncbi:MAG TPA: trehalase family glycosidase [Candidatus Acidoferrum sp.]|nr:trehalase family glycosidase [Candidatus Acidoferrum sp.]